MQIDYIVCPETIEEKLAKKHHVTLREVRQALLNNPRIRFAERVIWKAKMCMPHSVKPSVEDIYQFSLSSNQMRQYSDYN